MTHHDLLRLYARGGDLAPVLRLVEGSHDPVVEDPSARGLEDRPAEVLADGLASLTVETGKLERRRLAHIAALFAKRVWRDDHTTSDSPHYESSGRRRGAAHNMAAWVSLNLGTTMYRATRLTNCALAIERLPLTSQALETGVLSVDKVVELTRYVTPETERKEISWAKRRSVRAIRARGDELLQKDIEQIKEARRDSSLHWSFDEERMYYDGTMPADEGAAFVAAIEAKVKALAPCPTDETLDGVIPDTEGQRRSDALLELVRGGGGAADGGRAVTPEMIIHTSLHEDGFGNGVNGGRVVFHPETVKRLTCDARLRFVLTDEEGNALGIGHASPRIPAWLRNTVLKAYDFTCSFPGCDSRHGLDVHHAVHWSNGGPTDHTNLLPACGRHHPLLHEHGWTALRGTRGNVTWFTPNGREYLPGRAPPGVGSRR